MDKSYHIAYTLEQQRAFLEHLKSHKGYIAVDTETTGVDAFACDLMGISISICENEGFYFPVQTFTDVTVFENGIEVPAPTEQTTGSMERINDDRFFELQKDLIEILESKHNFIIMHNAAYDVWVLQNTMGINCLPRLHADTMLMKHTVNEKKPHGLKEVGELLLGDDAKDEQTDLADNVKGKNGKWTKTQKDMWMADLEILGKYACADADMTGKLFVILEKELQQQGLTDFYFKDEVHPLTLLIIEDMIGRGVYCDLEYYENLKTELTAELQELERLAHEDLQNNYTKYYEELEQEIIQKSYPLKERGVLFEAIYREMELPITMNKKTGKPAFTKKIMLDLIEDYPDNKLLQWKLGKITKDEFLRSEEDLVAQARKQVCLQETGSEYIINLSSNQQLGDLLFNKIGEKAIKLTDKNTPQVNDEVLTHFSKDHKFIDYLSKYRKNVKLVNTYIDGMITMQKDGVIRPAWMQHGTDSGRFACKKPNFQNLPRDDYRIKKGIIARPGFKLVGADYSQLEPRVFSHYSQERSLIEAYERGDDFYGTIAVAVFGYQGDPNTMKDDGEEAANIRQLSKALALAIAYGAMRWKVGIMTGKTPEEAQKDIDTYWKQLPNLKKFVQQSHGEALKYGEVKTQLGRVRHFDGIQALRKSKIRDDQKQLAKLLNISVNFKIQSTAGSIVNRAMIEIKKRFKREGVEGYVLIQVHDEIICEIKEDQAELGKEIMKDVMENNYKLDLPLIANPVIGDRLSELK